MVDEWYLASAIWEGPRKHSFFPWWAGCRGKGERGKDAKVAGATRTLLRIGKGAVNGETILNSIQVQYPRYIIV